jgi:hypothetical protein
VNLDAYITKSIPYDWDWCLFGACSNYRARAVLMSPDRRVQIGREGNTIDEALRAAITAARDGKRE